MVAHAASALLALAVVVMLLLVAFAHRFPHPTSTLLPKVLQHDCSGLVAFGSNVPELSTAPRALFFTFRSLRTSACKPQTRNNCLDTFWLPWTTTNLLQRLHLPVCFDLLRSNSRIHISMCVQGPLSMQHTPYCSRSSPSALSSRYSWTPMQVNRHQTNSRPTPLTNRSAIAPHML